MLTKPDHCLEVAELTAEVARRLLEEAQQRTWELGRTELRHQAAQRNAQAAATRAQTQHGRLERYLDAAALVSYPSWDGD